jgi:tetratricopeptide (TPR) repeat protein
VTSPMANDAPSGSGRARPSRAPRPRPHRRRPFPPWLIPVAIGLVITIAGGAAYWFAYVRPMREQLDAAQGYYDKGDYALATRTLDKVLARDPDQVEALLVLARVKAASGDSSGALKLYARVIGRRSDDAAVLYEMASLERLTGDTAAAVPHLEAALKSEPDNAQYLSELVKAYASTGKAAVGAELLLERANDAARTGPERAALYVQAAAALIEARADADAKAALERALELAPGDPSATRMLQQLK